MTPQESELVDELFNRLAQLETAQRDLGAERLIADGLRCAPHAVCALVQTVLLQDEALKRANARIEELQAQTRAAASRNSGRQVSSTACGKLSAAARRTAQCRAYARRETISHRASSRSRDIRSKRRSPDIRVLLASARADRFSAPQPQPPLASSAGHCCLAASAQFSAVNSAEPIPTRTGPPSGFGGRPPTATGGRRPRTGRRTRFSRRRRSTRQRTRPDGRRGFFRRQLRRLIGKPYCPQETPVGLSPLNASADAATS